MSQYASIFDFNALGLMPKALQNTDNATITAHLLKAGGLIDDYLRVNHTLPLTGTLGTATTPSTGFPDSIIDDNVCIARYRIMVRRGFVPDDHDLNFRQTYDDCIRHLEKLASGEIFLDGAADATPAFEGRPRVRTKPKRDWLLHQDQAQSSTGITEVGS